MGSKSSQADTKTETTTNLAISRDAVTQSGTQILDSIIVDPSDKVMTDLVNAQKASFEVLVSGQKAGISDVVNLGQKLLELASSNQISFRGMAEDTLRTSVDWLKEQMAAGRYVIDFSQATVNKSFDFAGQALDVNGQALQRALEITADVKTGDFANTLKTMALILAVFSLGAIYVARK